MRLLVLFFLSAVALSVATPLPKSIQDPQESSLEDFFTELTLEAEGKTSLEDVTKELKDRLNVFLKKVKDAIENGKAIKGDVLDKIQEIREKMKNLGIKLDDHGKDILEKIREKGRDFLKKILEHFGGNKRSIEEQAETILLQAEEDGNVVKGLREKFDELVKRLKDAFESGKSLKDGLEKLEEVRRRLKDLNIDVGDFGKDFLNQLKDKVKDYWNKLKERLGSKRNADIDVFGMIEQLKEMIKDKLSADKLKAFIEKFFGKGSELADQFVAILKDKSDKRKEKILAWIDRVFGDRKRSIKDVYEKIKNYFKDLNIELKEKFAKFGDYVKTQYEKGLEKGKSKLENIKQIAKQFLQDSRNLGKDVAEEALEFFREYKEDLGIVFDDIKAKVKDIVKQ